MAATITWRARRPRRRRLTRSRRRAARPRMMSSSMTAARWVGDWSSTARARVASGVLALSFLSGCQGAQDVLDPAGPPNRTVNHLFWAMLIVAGIIWVAVIIAAFWAALSRRRV